METQTAKSQLVVNVSLTPELRADLDRLKYETKVPMAKLIRRALKAYIEVQRQEVKP